MHEMSIALNIIDIAKEYAEKEKANVIKEIELEIGTLAGIEFDALEFALAISIKNSLMENSKINIKKVQAISACLDCKHQFETHYVFENCPKCNSFNTKLMQGKELQVKSLLID